MEDGTQENQVDGRRSCRKEGLKNSDRTTTKQIFEGVCIIYQANAGRKKFGLKSHNGSTGKRSAVLGQGRGYKGCFFSCLVLGELDVGLLGVPAR